MQATKQIIVLISHNSSTIYSSRSQTVIKLIFLNATFWLALKT